MTGDQATLAAYDGAAPEYAAEWEDEQDAPDDLYAVLQRFFEPGSVFDIGCGSGRDTAWLAEHGWPATGFDASSGLLDEARRRHPDIEFRQAALPALAELGSDRASNVLCETVLMHLPAAEIAWAARRILELVEPGGVLYLSWRVTTGEDVRDPAGRLYSAFPASLVLDALADGTVLLEEEQRSLSSGRTVHRVVVRRSGSMR